MCLGALILDAPTIYALELAQVANVDADKEELELEHIEVFALVLLDRVVEERAQSLRR
jgi:hypothetical protein